jgi:aminoglycoside phosphotransferase (APT) family kinase protein
MALPAEALAAYLEAQLTGFRGPLTATRFPGGQSNPTWRITTASGTFVLRQKPLGALLPSAHAIEREYRVLQALHGGPVPVAAPLHLCEDASVIGAPFYLMAYVAGRNCFDPALPEIRRDERNACHLAAIATLAAIHGVDVDAAGLSGYGKPGNYFSRQIARWTTQYRASETSAIPSMDALIDELPAACPPDDGSAVLVHGDFRMDNLILAPDAPKVRAVVDWELSTLGHPLADLGTYCVGLRLPRNPVLPGLGGQDRGALGVPTEDALLQHYQDCGGRDPRAHWSFALAFSYFRLAAIAQGVAKRALQGNAASQQATIVGRMVPMLAASGVQALREHVPDPCGFNAAPPSP